MKCKWIDFFFWQLAPTSFVDLPKKKKNIKKKKTKLNFIPVFWKQTCFIFFVNLFFLLTNRKTPHTNMHIVSYRYEKCGEVRTHCLADCASCKNDVSIARRRHSFHLIKIKMWLMVAAFSLRWPQEVSTCYKRLLLFDLLNKNRTK